MAVSRFTIAVKTGITTLTSGCIMVRKAPFSLAMAADASSLFLMTFPINSRIDRRPAVIMENTNTRDTSRDTLDSRESNFLFVALTASPKALWFWDAASICSEISVACAFMLFKESVDFITLSVIFVYFASRRSTSLF